MTLATRTSSPDLVRHAYEEIELLREFETESERQDKVDRIGTIVIMASGHDAAIVDAMACA